MSDKYGELKRFCLCELESRVVTIPRSWKTAGIYEALVSDGAATEVETNNPLTRGFTISDAGKKLLGKLR